MRIHSDGGLRHGSHAAASWTLYGWIYNPENGKWSSELWASMGTLISSNVSSFVAEALALESAFDFMNGIL